jgi:hypothetical protein
MDADQFDQFARSMARSVSRRSVVRGLTTMFAGASMAVRPLTARGAPNPCNVYCAGESGPRGAQCRQACKACGGLTSSGFCYDEAARSYTCCAAGLTCFPTWEYLVGETVICCASGPQVCHSDGAAVCCAEGDECIDNVICCPPGVGACSDPSGEHFACGPTCYDACSNQRHCGETDSHGNCVANTCYNPCTQEAECGSADEQGNCSPEMCFNVCSEQMVCGPSNERGNCFNYLTCYDPCDDVDLCTPPDPYGNCYHTTCYDPALQTTVCGTPGGDGECIA